MNVNIDMDGLLYVWLILGDILLFLIVFDDFIKKRGLGFVLILLVNLINNGK